MSLTHAGQALLCLFLFQVVVAADTGFDSPVEDPYVSADGTVELAWSTLSGSEFQVRRFSDDGEAGTVIVYAGMDTATTVTGLPEGTFHFQVRSRTQDGDFAEWGSDSLVVSVEYIDGRLVIGLLSAGLVTCLAIVAAITLGHRKMGSDVVA